jgi:two-component system cell cycle response regulator CtrA
MRCGGTTASRVSPAEHDGRFGRVFDLDQCAGMRRLIARLADHGDRLACTVNLVESLPRSIKADIKVFFGSQANALMEARRLSSTPSGALRPPISSERKSARLIFLPEAVMRPSPGCSRLKAFRLYSLSSSTIRLAAKRRIQVRVLLVDDDAAIARSIELMLKIEEINVYRTDLGEEGVDLGKIYDYDIILLDLNLPDISGYEVLRSLRSAKVVTPVLILSGLASIEDKIRGLGLGADDYLSKPFHKDELIARIHALVRRSKGHAQSVIAVGDLIVDLEARNVELHGQKLHLTAKEYQILALLALRTGSTLTKEMFLNHLYGGLDDEPEAKIIDVFICKLRKKLANASGGQDYIETIWGRGYALREPTKQAIAS